MNLSCSSPWDICLGVRRRGNKYEARIRAGSKTLHMGRFDTEEAAARAYDEQAKELHVNPILNFLPTAPSTSTARSVGAM